MDNLSHNDDFSIQLEQLTILREKGAINESEFQKKKNLLTKSDYQSIPNQSKLRNNKTGRFLNLSTPAIISIIGAFLAILPALPIIGDVVPIVDVSKYLGGNEYINFWGDNYLGSSQHVTGWTTYRIQPIMMVIIFLLIGILVIIFSINSSKKFIQTENLIDYTIVLISGLFDLLMVYLKYSGPLTSMSNIGFSDSMDIFNRYAGLGMWMLILSSIAIIIGGIIGLKQNKTIY